jgi:hypothetical protein
MVMKITQKQTRAYGFQIIATLRKTPFPSTTSNGEKDAASDKQEQSIPLAHTFNFSTEALG